MIYSVSPIHLDLFFTQRARDFGLISIHFDHEMGIGVMKWMINPHDRDISQWIENDFGVVQFQQEGLHTFFHFFKASDGTYFNYSMEKLEDQEDAFRFQHYEFEPLLPLDNPIKMFSLQKFIHIAYFRDFDDTHVFLFKAFWKCNICKKKTFIININNLAYICLECFQDIFKRLESFNNASP
jgi:hypothetical protein